jgi:hypothetical protein
MTAASDEPNDRPVIAREAVYAVLNDGRTIEEAIDYFGITKAEYLDALANHAERTQLKALNEIVAARAERRR